MTICTGNPGQLWAYDSPSEDGNIHTVMSEKEILEFMKKYEQRYEVVQKEKGIILSDEDKIDDWVVVNWAYKVVNDDNN